MYLRERPHDVPDQEKMLWWIPVVVIKEEDLNFETLYPLVWLNAQKNVTLDSMPDSNHFIIVNPEEIGKKLFYNIIEPENLIRCRW